MARVPNRRRAVSAGAGAARHRQAQGGAPKKPSYKVVLEEVSEQRKLKTFLSFNAQAPPGFTFIPAGDPQLTNRCKQLARDDGSTVYIVSMSDPKHPELSHEVHRVGYHFSSSVVEKASTSLGVTLTESGRVLQSSFANLNEELPTRHSKKPKNKAKGKGRASPSKFDLSQSQAMIDTQAREAIKDLFPKIPEADLHETVARSFQKGRDLVGTSSDLSLARRAHLAVLAHIRHTHTNYDNILKLVPWSEARKRVEGPTLDILISWRDDVDDDTNVMRDVLREVIIISDNEDEDDDLTNVDSPRVNRELREKSVEIISASSNVHTQRLDLASEPSELENDHRVQYIPRAYPPNSDRPFDRLREKRQGAQRHQRWEEAVSRRREGASSSNLYPRAAQLISEPLYHASPLSNLHPPSHISSKQVSTPLLHAYEDQRITQYDDSHLYLPQQRVGYRPQHTVNTMNDGLFNSSIPIRQIRHSSEHHPTTTTLNPEYYRRPHRPTELAAGHRYPSPENSQQVRQPPLELSAERRRFVEIQQPTETTEVHYKSTNQLPIVNDERQRRRHQSERILPSVEMDEFDVRATARVAREDPMHLDHPPYEITSHGRPQYVLDYGNEPHKQNSDFNLERAHHDQEVYIVEERPRRPPQFENRDRDRVVYASFDGNSSAESRRHRGTVQDVDEGPIFVQYNPRVVQLPPRTREEVPHTERQVYAVPRLRPDGDGRSSDFGTGDDHVIPFEVRRASYTQPIQQNIHRADPYGAATASPIYPAPVRNFSTVESPVSRVVRIDDVGDRKMPSRADEHNRPFQLYDERGRLVQNHAILQREPAMYTSSR